MYFKNGDSLYVNFGTVLLGTVLSLQINLFLIFEKKIRDPFVLLLCLQMVLYFLFRILTLYVYSFSVVFLRYPFSVEDVNYSLFFIIIANFVFYLGLSINRLNNFSGNNISGFLPKNTKLVLVPLVIGYFFSFYNQIGLSRLSGIINVLNGTFLNMGIIIFIVLVCFISKKVDILYVFILLEGSTCNSFTVRMSLCCKSRV